MVIGTGAYHEEIVCELEEMGFEIGEDYYDWFKSALPYSYMYKDVYIGKQSYFSWPCYIMDKFLESIGEFVAVNYSSILSIDHNINMLTIGNVSGILTAEAVNELEAKYARNLTKHNRVIVGNNVWIGAHTFINASKVKSIGNGAIIGAGAVVLEDIPPYAVVVGVPAKVKKYRYTPEQIEILERVKWWDWDNETISRNAEYLYNPEMFFERFKNSNIPD